MDFVNIAKVFGNNLDSVPWYRFGYWSFIWVYWKIMWKEFRNSSKYE